MLVDTTILCKYFILLLVVIRKMWNVNGMKRLPPASGDCLWQLEKMHSQQFNGMNLKLVLI